jgi:hypothetical protein
MFAFLIAAGAMLVAVAVAAALSLAGMGHGDDAMNERFTLRSN